MQDVVLGKVSTHALPQFMLQKNSPLLSDPRPFYHLSSMHKVHLLKYFVEDFLDTHKTQKIGNKEMNGLMLNILLMLQAMVDCGFYGTAEGIKNFLAKPLFRVLDGR